MTSSDTPHDLVSKTLAEVSSEHPSLNYWWLRRMCALRRIEFTKVGKQYCLTPTQVRAAWQMRHERIGTGLSNDVARENERRALRPRRRRLSKAA